jgi:hypothetical protein
MSPSLRLTGNGWLPASCCRCELVTILPALLVSLWFLTSARPTVRDGVGGRKWVEEVFYKSGIPAEESRLREQDL